jgi:GNAT superfamily N-acetyltransferase
MLRSCRSVTRLRLSAVTGIDVLYERHRANGIPILSPPEDKPWGLREYTVRDPNGYRLRFGEPQTAHATSTARKALPPTVRIIERLPTVEEYITLTDAVGWTKDAGVNGVRAGLKNSLFGAVAVDGESVVGMVRLVGDAANVFYVQDVVVRPDYQRKGIGTALMDAVIDHFQRSTPRHFSIGLFTGRHLAGFYERHGFEGPDTSLYGMYLNESDMPPIRPAAEGP